MSAVEPIPFGIERAVMDLADGAIPPRVLELLATIEDNDDRRRFTRFFSKASAAIELLGELDVGGAVDIGREAIPQEVFEELMAELERTLRCVRAFIEVVGEEFAAVVEESANDDFDDLSFFADDAPPSPPADPAEELANVLAAICANMAHAADTTEARLRGSASGEELWNLLSEIEEYRGRSRAGVGEMVFLAASYLRPEVARERVVPSYREELDSSLKLRQAITTLREHVAVLQFRFNEVALTDREACRECIARFARELISFMAGGAFRIMRARDKRSFFAMRHAFEALVATTNLGKGNMERAIEGLVRFLESLLMINDRELLVAHDTHAVTEVKRALLATVRGAADDQADAARIALGLAFEHAGTLLGCNPAFDRTLAWVRYIDPFTVSAADALGLARHLLGQELISGGADWRAVLDQTADEL